MKILVTKIGKNNYSFTYDGNIFTGGRETFGINNTPDNAIKASVVKYDMEKEGKNHLSTLYEMSERISRVEIEYI